MGKPRGNGHEGVGKCDRRRCGRLQKLKSGRVQAGYIGPDCKPHLAPATFAPKIDAEGWLADRIATPQGDTGSLRSSPQKDYPMLLRNHILPTLGDKRPDEIGLDDVVAWHRAMAKNQTRRGWRT